LSSNKILIVTSQQNCVCVCMRMHVHAHVCIHITFYNCSKNNAVPLQCLLKTKLLSFKSNNLTHLKVQVFWDKMLRHWRVVSDISKDHSAFIFNVKQVFKTLGTTHPVTQNNSPHLNPQQDCCNTQLSHYPVYILIH
jgi:hypothetical protein